MHCHSRFLSTSTATGGYGFDSMNASPEEIDTMVRRMTAEEGITSYFCTTMTQSYEQIETAMKNIRAAAEQNPVIQGIHVEGPFVSANYKGAQNEEYIRKPDARALARWNDLSGRQNPYRNLCAGRGLPGF